MPIYGPPSSPSILTPTLVATSGAKITGDTNEHIAAYINVPGGLLGANGSVDTVLLVDTGSVAGTGVKVWVRIVAGTSAGTLAGTSLVGGITLGNAGNRLFDTFSTFNSGATNAQIMFATGSHFASTSGAFNTAAIDTTQSFTLSYNLGLATGTDSTWFVGARSVVWSKS